MSPIPFRNRWHGPPLAMRILALLIGGLVVAQGVTLALTLLLPPAPATEYSLDDIATALRGGAIEARDNRMLVRVVQAGPPDLSGPGWLVSDRSRRDLARLLRTDVGEVSLSFYTPLPFAGTAAPRPMAFRANDELMPAVYSGGEARLTLIQMSGDATPVLPSSSQTSATQSWTSQPPAASTPARQLRADRALPARNPLREEGVLGDIDRVPGRVKPGASSSIRAPSEIGFTPRASLYAIAPASEGIVIPGDGGVAVPPLLNGGRGPTNPFLSLDGSRLSGPPAVQLAPVPPAMQPAPVLLPPVVPPAAAPAIHPEMREMPAAIPAPRIVVQDDFSDVVQSAPPVLTGPPAPGLDEMEPPAGPAIAVTPTQRGLFGLAPAPFVQGDFVAAWRLADGRWSVVQPAPEPFPNSWQRRVLLWFAIALAIVCPVGWLFARRLVKPLSRFADAAATLGRDPAAPVLALEGPAEIGRAAQAFNIMQTRLHAFVDDRTAMIGAISHDLRTPLTRMRFRIEEVDDDAVREGLGHEVGEMEVMIASVLDFIRDASSPGRRERLDLRLLVEDAVEDAQLIGSDVTFEQAEPAQVDVDVQGVRRLLDNLLENAVKYGDRARIRVTTDAETVLAEIIDSGPGMAEHELERAFEPFYRSDRARASGKGGSGLGLAVCRSIARAHGGDVRLMRSPEGFAAQIKLPLALATA